MFGATQAPRVPTPRYAGAARRSLIHAAPRRRHCLPYAAFRRPHAPSNPIPELSSHAAAGNGTGWISQLEFIGTSAPLPSAPTTSTSDEPAAFPGTLLPPMKMMYCDDDELPKAKSFCV